MQKLTRLIITIISAALIFSSGISIASETMKITYSRGIDDLPLYVALEEGLWEKEGIKVELVRLVGEHNIIAAALHGDIDAGHLDLGGAFHAGLQNIPVKVVAWLGHAHKGTRCGLHVDQKSNINSIADLKGKRIAESGTITTAMILSETLKTVGMDKNDIKAIKGIKLDDAMKHEAALRSKGVDVIVA
ncbi:MAG: ABC transporter substrate-binding protein [Desulfatiglans sp.]|nr:ABC transporter substrate-binding protein [Desulfatiglans sp.]